MPLANHDDTDRLDEDHSDNCGIPAPLLPDAPQSADTIERPSARPDSLEVRPWRDSGFTDQQTAAWLAAGYASPAAAMEWTAIGIDAPTVAQKWIDAGFTPDSASLWVEVEDMEPSEAATCANNGMTPVDVERVRRADPGWTRPEPEPGVADAGWGIEP
jgi:hypothetical protein